MARTVKDLEAYLAAIGRHFDVNGDGTMRLEPSTEGGPPTFVRTGDPVVFSIEIGKAPSGDSPTSAKFFRRLLELNASDLLYCAYGLRGEDVVLSAAHELENLDLNEVQAVLGDMDLALARHMKELVSLSGTKGLHRSWECSRASRSSSRPTSTI